MSYILDALKKAEAERTLGSVPNIHAQPIATALPAARRSFRRGPLMWIALTALAIVFGALAWLKPWNTAPGSMAAAPQAAQSAPKTAGAEPKSAPLQPPSANTPMAVPSAAEAPPAAAAGPAAAATQPADELPPPEASVAKPAKPKAVPKPARKPKENKPAQPAKSSEPQLAKNTEPPPESRVAMLRELPENIQREIPALTISGYIYAGNPADRSVLI
ncbi:MAG: hypothetical protein JWQ21_4163, partial [Herminiimonas sp.]|nr:hypothetical protein [Herminiimonas sp.]